MRIVRQSAALPYRRLETGIVEFLLITAKRSERWLIPKGHLEPGLTAAQSAAVEAWEEAGVRGEMTDIPIGRFTTRKMSGFLFQKAIVDVFPMEVEFEADTWPEMGLRRRRWVRCSDAADVVGIAGLSGILRLFAAEIADRAA